MSETTKNTTLLEPTLVSQFALNKTFTEIKIDYTGEVVYPTKDNELAAYQASVTHLYNPLGSIQDLIAQDTELYGAIAQNMGITSDEWQIAALAQKTTRNDGEMLIFTLKAVSQDSRKKSLRGKLIIDELSNTCRDSIETLFKLLLDVVRNQYAHDNAPLHKDTDIDLEEIEIEL